VNDLNKLICNKNILYLSKIKKINFKMEYSHKFKIYISPCAQSKYIDIIKLIFKKIKSYSIVKTIDEIPDIAIFLSNDNIKLNKNTLNICINYDNNEDNDEDNDINICGSKKLIDNYNIYFPYLFINLWERKNNGKILFNDIIIKNKDENINNINNIINKKKFFCSYLNYENIVLNEELYDSLLKYKLIDNLDEIYTNEKYNDLLVEKYSEYKFVLSIENILSNGFISERIINPILANSIPIYYGDKDVFNIINKKRVIYINDYNNYDDLLEYIKKVDNDPVLYKSIISENIFIGDIRYDNFEEYLSDKIDKSFGLKSKNITVNNLYKNNVDFVIKDLKTDLKKECDITLMKRYLSNFIRDDDNIINYINILHKYIT
jgi:hypothetical protein